MNSVLALRRAWLCVAALSLCSVTMPSPAAGLAPSLLDEACSARERDDQAPDAGLPPDLLISCAGATAGTLAAARLPANNNGTPLPQALANAFTGSRAAAALQSRLNCRMPSARTLAPLGFPDAVGVACRTSAGGWPQLLLLAAHGGRLMVAEGTPASLPALLSSIDPGARAMPRTAYADTLREIFGSDVPLASAADLAGFKASLQGARAANAQGRYREAEVQFRSALALQSRLLRADDIAIAETLMDFALNVSNQGRDEEALALFRRAEPIVQKSPRDEDRVRFATYQGYHAANAGRYDEALKFASAAVAGWRKIDGGPNLDFMLPGAAGASAARTMRKGELALALNLQAGMALRNDDVALAQSAATEALAVLDKAPSLPRWWRADVLLTLGKVSSAQGRLSAAETYLNTALEERKLVSGDGPQLLPILVALARAYQREGMNTSAIITYRDVFARVRKLQASTDSPLTLEDLVPYGLAVTAHADTLADDQQRQGLYNEAFEAFGLLRPPVVEQTVARASARLGIDDPALAKLAGELQAAERARESALVDLSFETSLPDAQRSRIVEDRLQERLSAADRAASELQVQLRARFPAYHALSSPAPLQAIALRERLAPDEGVVSFLIGREASFVQLVRRDGLWIAPVEDGSAALADMVGQLRAALEQQGGTVKEFDLVLAHRLHERLFGRLRAQLDGLSHLVVVPSGPLASLPFSLLVERQTSGRSYADAAWLVRRMAISHAPSLRSFYLQRAAAPAARAPKALLAFGNPQLTGKAVPRGSASDPMLALASSCRQDGPAPSSLLRSLAPLPDTETELRQVQRALGADAASLFTRERATETRLRSEALQDYRVLYFATHGLLPGELQCQAEPALVLTPPSEATARADDGLLEASEVASLKLNADLVVLSACNTAGGAGRFGGDALSGLAEAFFHAGARSLLASHWQVPSKATAELMAGVFDASAPDARRGIAGALRRAQLNMIRSEATAHPFSWAAFVIVGDGRRDLLAADAAGGGS